MAKGEPDQAVLDAYPAAMAWKVRLDALIELRRLGWKIPELERDR